MGLLVIATLRLVCVWVCGCACEINSRTEEGREGYRKKKSGGKEKRKEKESGDKGRNAGRCGLEYGFGFPSLRSEQKAIDSEAESKADQVAAQGCTGTQCEHDLDTNKVTA